MSPDALLAAPFVVAAAAICFAGARYMGRAFAVLLMAFLVVAVAAGFAFSAITLS